MKFILSFVFLCFIFSCTFKKSEEPEKVLEKPQDMIDTSKKEDPLELSYSEYYDSLANVVIDTSSLVGKRKWIMHNFHLENRITHPDFDSLLDLNYDGEADYVIGYYGQSGTGIKNFIKVYLFNRTTQSYIFNDLLSELPNPSFYILEKKITSFYLANGGGNGIQLEWKNKKWVVTKEFEVDFKGDSSKWIISYPLEKKRQEIMASYQFIPPRNILETNFWEKE